MAGTVLITGASSGFGQAAAALFQQRGWNVAASMRAPRKAGWPHGSGMFTPQLDVTDQASMEGAVAETIGRFGQIDVLVNNAGYGLFGPLEGAAPEALERQLATNVLGPMRMIQLVAPHMRRVGRGVIINVTSIGGRLTFPLYSSYHATKFALEGLTEALQYELEGHGILVKLVEPGASRTNFAGTSLVEAHHPAYQGLIDGMLRVQARLQQRIPGPEKVAQTIYRAATDPSKRLRYPVLAFPLWHVRSLIGSRGWSTLMKGMARRAANPA